MEALALFLARNSGIEIEHGETDYRRFGGFQIREPREVEEPCVLDVAQLREILGSPGGQSD